LTAVFRSVCIQFQRAVQVGLDLLLATSKKANDLFFNHLMHALNLVFVMLEDLKHNQMQDAICGCSFLLILVGNFVDFI